MITSMNRFVPLLIVLPLVATVLVMFGLLVAIVQGPQWDNIIPFIILGSIATYLVKLLQRTGTSESRIVEQSLRSEKTETSRPFSKSLMYGVVLGVCGLAGYLVIALVGFGSLRYWVGGICFILSIFSTVFAWLANRSLQQSPPGSDTTAQVALFDQSLIMMRKSRNYVLGSYPLIALYLIWTYQAAHGEGFFSAFDLLGVLFVLTTSAFWFVMRVRALSRQRERLV